MPTHVAQPKNLKDPVYTIITESCSWAIPLYVTKHTNQIFFFVGKLCLFLIKPKTLNALYIATKGSS